MSNLVPLLSTEDLNQYHPLNMPPRVLPWSIDDLNDVIMDGLPSSDVGVDVKKTRLDAHVWQYTIYNTGFELVFIRLEKISNQQTIFQTFPPDDILNGASFFFEGNANLEDINKKYPGPMYAGPVGIINNLSEKYFLAMNGLMRLRINNGTLFIKKLIIYCKRFLEHDTTGIPPIILEELHIYFSEIEVHGKLRGVTDVASLLRLINAKLIAAGQKAISKRTLETHITSYREAHPEVGQTNRWSKS